MAHHRAPHSGVSHMTRKLEAGDPFPQLKLNIVDGSTVALPDDIATPQAIVLFYRGHW